MELVKSKNKITSLELVEQINIFRKEDGKSELGHNDLLKVIRDEFEEEISLGKISQSEYISERGQKYPMFSLTTSQAKQVLVRESKTVRKAVIKYIEQLENSLQPKIPLNYIEALKQLIEVETEKEALKIETQQKQLQINLQQEKIQEDAPKVEFYDEIASTTSTFDMQETAAMLKLGYGRNTLFKKLREANILMKDNLPFIYYIESEYFNIIETSWVNNKTQIAVATTQTRTTQKGLNWLLINKEKFKL